jgi:AraC family transcriptional regulator
MSAPIGVGDMYDKDLLSSPRTSAMPDGSTAATIDDWPSGAALDSLHRLRSAVVELSTALNETLRDERNSAAACLQRAKAILQGVDHTSLRPGVRQGLAPWQVRRVIAYIEANLDTSIRNKDLATLARLSEYHFNVAFRNSVGEAPHGYIIRRRVERAQGLMLSTEKSLSDIAAECGMADQAHMTRLFRSIVGESPAAWRRARVTPVA